MTVDEIRESLEHGPLFDGYILKHGFAPYIRDYDVVVEWPRHRRFLYRFSHVPLATVNTAVKDSTWRDSWGDIYIDYSARQGSGSPDGYVWGVCSFVAYPGAKYVEDSVEL